MTTKRFGKTFLLVVIGLLVVIYGLLVALDPYDRGFGLIRKTGTIEKGPRTAAVSRARNQAFDAAIFGNSHAQILRPDRLNASTGFNFSKLIVQGTGPREELVLLDWYLAHRRTPAKAIVVSVDSSWCSGLAEPVLPNPFPFWLYGDKTTYLKHIFRLDTLTILPRRLALVLGLQKPIKPDGFDSYEELYRSLPRRDLPRLVQEFDHLSMWPLVPSYPSIDKLTQRLGIIPAQTKVVLLVPPFYAPILATSPPAAVQAEKNCIAALQRAADARPRTALINWQRISPETSLDSNFWDLTHYADPLALAIEADIIAALKRLD